MSPADHHGHPRVALIGAGRMGQAVLSGLLRAGWDLGSLVAVESHEETARAVRDRLGIRVVAAPDAIVDSDVVVVAVKPQHVTGALDAATPHLGQDTLVVSLAAGLPITTLAEHLPPGIPLVRVMPNTPALVGEGMSVMSPAPGCPPEATELARTVLAAVGRVDQVAEAAQDAVTAVSGSGPAYVFYVAEAMIEAGVALGLPRPLAHELTVQTLVGASTMLRDSGEHPTVLRENVTSPGGTTAAALHVLDQAAVRAAFADAMRACAERSADLSKG